MSTKTAVLHVKDVMTHDVVTVPAAASLKEALELMEENHVSALPVVDHHEAVVGILSATDLVELARQIESDLSDIEQLSDVSRIWLIEEIQEHRLGQTPLTELMTDSVATVRETATLAAAARVMLRKGVHRLPVVDEEKKVIGIVSTTDLLEALVEGKD